MDLFVVERPVNHRLGTQLQAPLIPQTHPVQCTMLPLKEQTAVLILVLILVLMSPLPIFQRNYIMATPCGIITARRANESLTSLTGWL